MDSTLNFFLDVIEDAVVFGKADCNINKFLLGIKNKKIPFIRSNDVRQSAVYMYILWLKRGFHIKPYVGTNYVPIINSYRKEKAFNAFKKSVNEYAEKIVSINPVRDAFITLKRMNERKRNEIYQVEIIEAFMHFYYAWVRISRLGGN